jgi:hypothetical protein
MAGGQRGWLGLGRAHPSYTYNTIYLTRNESCSLRLSAVGTLKRYSKALEYKYRVKTVALGTLKRYSILSLRACLDDKFSPKFHYAKRRFPITSKYRYMHEVLNVDEIKN